jgi:hypothetical protein
MRSRRVKLSFRRTDHETTRPTTPGKTPRLDESRSYSLWPSCGCVCATHLKTSNPGQQVLSADNTWHEKKENYEFRCT